MSWVYSHLKFNLKAGLFSCILSCHRVLFQKKMCLVILGKHIWFLVLSLVQISLVQVFLVQIYLVQVFLVQISLVQISLVEVSLVQVFLVQI